MTVYIDIVYLFNKHLKQTARQQSVKYHVGNWPKGKQSIVLNKYNLFIDSALSIMTMINNDINMIQKHYPGYQLKMIVPNNYEFVIPIEYNGYAWDNHTKRYNKYDKFEWILTKDIKECLQAYTNAIDILGRKMVKGLSFDDVKRTNDQRELINDFKTMNPNWEQLVLTNPQSVDVDIQKILCDKFECRQLRLIYYNQDILKQIYNVLIKRYPTVDNIMLKDYFCNARKIADYTKQIKFKLGFSQARLIHEEIYYLFNYVVDCCNIPFDNQISDDKYVVISKFKYISSSNDITNSCSIRGDKIVNTKKHPDMLKTPRDFKQNHWTLLTYLRNINTDIPIIDIDEDRHINIFIQYSQTVLYGTKFTQTLITDYNWKQLKNGLNSSLFVEYEQNIQLVINKFKFNHFQLH